MIAIARPPIEAICQHQRLLARPLSLHLSSCKSNERTSIIGFCGLYPLRQQPRRDHEIELLERCDYIQPDAPNTAIFIMSLQLSNLLSRFLDSHCSLIAH